MAVKDELMRVYQFALEEGPDVHYQLTIEQHELSLSHDIHREMF